MVGFIKLHRKLQEWEWYNKSEMVHLFIHLLINSNSKDKEWQKMIVKRGQLITGFSSLSEKTGISIRTLRTCFERLKSTGELSVKTTNKFSIVTVCKYDDYNDLKTSTDKQNDTPPVTLPTTTKKYKKKEDNTNSIDRRKLSFSKSLIPFVDLYGKDVIRSFCDYWTETTKSKTKFKQETEKTWDTEKRLKRWIDNDFNKPKRAEHKVVDQSNNANLY